MATDKPRITVSLEPEHYAILQRLAKLQKAPMARLVAELVAEVSPVLSKVADSLEIAMRAQAGVKVQLRRAADEAEAELRPLVEAVKNQFDLFNAQAAAIMEPLVSATDETGPGSAGVADAPGPGLVVASKGGSRRRPPSSNTGATDSQRASESAGVMLEGVSLNPKRGKGSKPVGAAKVFADADNNGRGARLLSAGASPKVK